MILRPRRTGGMPMLRAAACVLLSVVLAGCGGGGGTSEDATPDSLADTVRVPPEQETFFTDVPVDGFDALAPEIQAEVAARANRARCDCGCFGHSVNACLHMRETCDVAVRIASRFVAEARMAEQVGSGRSGGDAPPGEPAALEAEPVAPVPDASAPDAPASEVPASEPQPAQPEPAASAPEAGGEPGSEPPVTPAAPVPGSAPAGAAP